MDKESLKGVERAIERADNIVVTCHVKPDGDAVGSSLGLWHVLGQLGKKVDVVTPDTPPHYLNFLPGFDDITSYSTDKDYAGELFVSADVVFCLDFNASYRVDRMEEALLSSSGVRIMIDHHLEPEAFADITVSSPSDSSTCLLLYKVLCQLGLKPLIEKQAATCLAAGMMTDTGNFAYNANDPDAYRVMAELLACGVDKVAIWDKLNVKSEQQLRLTGYALSEKMRILCGGHTALIALSKEELDRFGYEKGDLEGLVNVPLQMPDVQLSALMHQEPGFIKVSLRSQGRVPVNRIAESYFGGGGHLNAAGGEYRGTMEECAALFEKVVPEYEEFFKN